MMPLIAFRSLTTNSREASSTLTSLLNRFCTSKTRLFQLWVICKSSLRYGGNHRLMPKKKLSRLSPSMQKMKDQRGRRFMPKITRLHHLGLKQKIQMVRITSLWSIHWVELQPSTKAGHFQGWQRKLKREFRNFPGQSRHLKWVWNSKAEVKLTAFSISPRLTKTQGSRTNLEGRVWIKTAAVTWEMRRQAVSPMSQTLQ